MTDKAAGGRIAVNCCTLGTVAASGRGFGWFDVAAITGVGIIPAAVTTCCPATCVCSAAETPALASA